MNLFNHESPRAEKLLLLKKLFKVDKNKNKNKDKIYLGNLYAKRDWGHAEDYVKVMWLMLQAKPKDYVIAPDTNIMLKSSLI